MPVLTDISTVSEHVKLRKPRTQICRPISETDPNLRRITNLIQTTSCKSTISSLLLSTFSPTPTPTPTANNSNEAMPTNLNVHNKKKINFTSSTLRGLGCTAGVSQQVSVPEVIRTSADWPGHKSKKKKKKKKQIKNISKNNKNNINKERNNHQVLTDGFTSASCLDFQDVWCGPGIGFSIDATASVDCVVSRRNVSGRGKIDGDKMNGHREPSYFGRQTIDPESISFLDFESDFVSECPMPEVFRTRYSHHIRYPSPEGRNEMLLLQRSVVMGGRPDIQDRFRDLRLDVDNMSYELMANVISLCKTTTLVSTLTKFTQELLELGEKIGYVSTGLKEEEISRCIRKIKLSLLSDMSLHLSVQVDKKCIVCQEEYEEEDEMGKLECGHGFHMVCIKHWLLQKNTCPVCKTEAASRRQ